MALLGLWCSVVVAVVVVALQIRKHFEVGRLTFGVVSHEQTCYCTAVLIAIEVGSSLLLLLLLYPYGGPFRFNSVYTAISKVKRKHGSFVRLGAFILSRTVDR